MKSERFASEKKEAIENPLSLPSDAWNLIAENSGLFSIKVLPLISTDTKDAYYDDRFWQKMCRLHFPLTVASSASEEKEIDWLNRFKELELTHYPSDQHTKHFLRTVKEGVLEDVKELKPTLDQLHETEDTLKRFLPSKSFYTPITWTNKLDRQDILNYLYQLAHLALAPDKKDSRGYDLVTYYSN